MKKISYRIGNGFGIKLHAFFSRLSDSAGKHSYFATKKFIKWIKSYNPDVIHLHNLHGYYINVKLLFNYLKICGKKIIWTLHDCWAFTGHCAYFTDVNCEKWKECCDNCLQKKAYPKSLIDGSYKNYLLKKGLFTGIEKLTIVTPSIWLKNLVKQSFLKDYEVKVIPNGIDLNIFKPAENRVYVKNKYNLPDKKIILGVASFWSEEKGFYDFIRLSELIDANKYQIVLVGNFEKVKKDVTGNVITLSGTDNMQELVSIYSFAHIFVNPSRHETMGLTTVEALACGTPVIVYNNTAIAEVCDGSCSVVLDKCTPEEICTAIDKCNFDSDACIRRAKEYDKIKRFNEYLDLFLEW